MQQNCPTQEADCVLTCCCRAEDGDASSISSPAADPCCLSSVCTTRLLLTYEGGEALPPPLHHRHIHTERVQTEIMYSLLKQQLLVTHFNFPLARCQDTFTVFPSCSTTTSPFYSHSFNQFVGYRLFLVLQYDLPRYAFAMTQQ